jgi:hypothetical protein
MDEVVIKLTVDAVNAAQSVGELKQIIKDASSEALKFGQGSIEFSKFANVAAQATAKLTDVKKAIQALNPDASARSFLQLGNTIVGGFTAAQGAMNLFGASTDDVQKALLKVQSAMALLQGFQAIQQGIQAFEGLRAAVILAVEGMSALKAAIITTGIGALVVILGILIDKFGLLDDKVKEVDQTLLDSQEELKGLQLEYKKLTGAINDVQYAITKAEEVYNKKLKDIQDGTKEKLEKTQSFWNQFWNIVSTGGNVIAGALKTANQVADIFAKSNADTKAATEVFNQEKENIEQDARNKANAKRDKDEETYDKINLDAKLNRQGIAFDMLLGQYIDFQAKTDAVLQKVQTSRDGGLARNLAAMAKDQQHDQQLWQFKVNIAKQSTELILGIASLFVGKSLAAQKRAFEIQNAAGIASAIVDTYVSAASIFKNAALNPSSILFPAAPYIEAGLAIAAGVVRVAKIARTTFDSGSAPSSDSGFSGGGRGDVGTGIPSGVNELQQPTTTLGQGGTTPVPSQPIVIKNIISEHEITVAQNSIGSIVAQATIH